MTAYIYNKGKQEAASEPLNDQFDDFMRLPQSEQAAIMQRLENLGDGVEYNIQNAKPVRPNVFELKFRGGQKDGWRIYYTKVGDDVVLLTAGDKNTQDADIRDAERYRDDALKRVADARRAGKEPEDVFREVNPEEFYRSAERNGPQKGKNGEERSNGRTATQNEPQYGAGPQRVPNTQRRPDPRVVTAQGGNDHPTSGANAYKLDRHPEADPPPQPGKKPFIVRRPGEEQSTETTTQEPARGKLIQMPNPGGGTGGEGETTHVAPEAGPSAPETGAGAGMSGYMTYSGVMQIGRGVGEFNSGDKTRGVIDGTMGTINAGAGTAGVMEAVAPGTIEKIAGEKLGQTLSEGLEGAMPILMVVQAGYEIASAPAGEKGKAAYRVTGSMAPAVAMMGGEGAGAILWPVGAGIVGTMAVERDIALTDLQNGHEKAMKDIRPDNAGHSHLRAEADRLQNTLILAQYGDTLAMDSKGKVDISSKANLDKIKAAMSPEKQREMEKRSYEQADEFIRINRQGAAQTGGGDPYMFKSEKEMRDMKAELARDYEKQELQGQAAMLEGARQARHDYFPPDARLALGPDGKIALTTENLNTMREVLRREHDGVGAQAAGADQMSAYWNMMPNSDLSMTQGEQKLREHIAREEELKRIDTATAEINNIQFGGRPLTADSIPRQQQAEDIERLKAGHDPDKIAAFYATVFRNDQGTIIGDPAVPDTADKTYLDAAVKEYEAHRAYYREHGNVVPVPIYKTDDKNHLMLGEDGKPIAEKIVLWKINDPDYAQAMAQGKQNDKKAENQPPLDPQEKARRQARQALEGGQKYDHRDMAENAPPPVVVAGQQQAQIATRV